MVELTAYSLKLRKNVAIKDPELVTLKNGRMAVRGGRSGRPIEQGRQNCKRQASGRGSTDARLIGLGILEARASVRERAHC